MSYFEECLAKFNNLPADFKNKIGNLKAFEKIEAVEEEYGVELKFLVVLVAIGELSLMDVPEYLQTKYKIYEEDAYEIRDWLIKDIFELDTNVPASSDPGDSENIFLQSKMTVTEIFREGLVKFLKDQAADKVKDINNLNEAIFYWLAQDGDLQEELSKLLLANQEKLTELLLSFEDREIAPTITNWLKDFIKLNGSELFDELVLAQYLSNSQNCKKLDQANKDLVRKLLKLYRNLVFFPDSMEGVLTEDWQIIPVNKEKENKKVPEKLKEIVEKEKDKPIRAAIDPKQSTLNELQQALASYTPNSLEHKAVQQEISRLKKKK